MLLAAMPTFALEEFGEYSIVCDNMKYVAPGTQTDWLTFQPEGNDIERVKTAYGRHSTRNDGNWKVEFDLKVTSLEKDQGTPLLQMELTTTGKAGDNGRGIEVVKSGWLMFDQLWVGVGFLRTEGGTLIRLECTRGKKSSPRDPQWM